MYKIFISLRYLRSRLISLIATGVLALGVAVLLIVTSVMGGFQREFHRHLRGHVSDVAIHDVSDRPFPAPPPETLAELERTPHVVAVAPYLQSFVGIVTKLDQDHGILRGIDPEREKAVGDIEEFLLSERERIEAQLEGYAPSTRAFLRESMREEIAAASAEKPDPARLLREPTKSGKPPLLVGVNLYVYGRMRIGDVVTLYTANPEREIDPQQIERKDVREGEFEIAGVFKTGMYEIDRRTAVTALEAAQEFLGVAGSGGATAGDGGSYAERSFPKISGLSIKLDDYEKAEEVAAALQPKFLYLGLFVKPWNRQNENLMKAVRNEQFLVYFIVFFMIVLASVCLAAILTLGVIEKTKDLGILGSVGATRGGLLQIFLYQGGIIAAIGAAIGTGFGLLFLKYINEIDEHVIGRLAGRRVFDPSVYYIDRIPNEVSGWGLFWCIVPTIVLGFLMALYPGYRAATLDPIEALRYE